jgi:Ca-activated chloride channel family protein
VTLEFLRPAWLLLLPAGLALAGLWWRARAGAGPWRRLVDPELLAHLAAPAHATSARLALGAALAAFALACVALAGPTWRKQPAPLVQDLSARIVVLDLSPSMDAVDVVPSRLERARAAAVAVLRESGEAQLGLVVFGADAFTVAPLMNDPGALVHLLASLKTGTVPRAGSRPDLGLAMARELLERTQAAAGDVILIGDSAGGPRALEAAHRLNKAGFPLSVLAVGTPQGGPVRIESGAFARTAGGEILVARPELAGLERVARAGGGRFHLLGAGGEAPHIARRPQVWAEAPSAPARASDVRQDDGAWLVLLALPFAALLFRRGWLAGVAVLALALPPPAEAFEWAALWRRADQRAAAEFSTGRIGGQPEMLERLAPGSPWRAPLLYRSGRFAEAAAEYARRDTADAHYNRGNALALDGRLEEALAAYGAALERSPSMRDALFNRALVREALARRRAEARRGGAGDSPRSLDAPLLSTVRPGEGEQARDLAAGGGQDAQGEAQASAGQGARDPETSPAAPPAAGPGREGALDPAELRRIEALLAQVPDDPGTLLANRFVQQLRMRGNWRYDTGEPW